MKQAICDKCNKVLKKEDYDLEERNKNFRLLFISNKNIMQKIVCMV